MPEGINLDQATKLETGNVEATPNAQATESQNTNQSAEQASEGQSQGDL